ncbi:DNRLRE domain-containing protein [Streptomyces roseoviridis]|uniref:DNRLRE domain-containing protein n=1 Tax=Streptomyces roseoviridis TaxID=67361 RepID=UPI0031F19482
MQHSEIPRRRPRAFRGLAVPALGTALLLALEASLTAVAPLSAAEPITAARPNAQPAVGGGETSALLRARLEKKRVEVTDRRTETLTVWANPDGTLTEDHSAGPVRYRDAAGAWRDVDVTLAAQADGSVRAKAHPLDVKLAGPSAPQAGAATARRLTAATPAPAATPLVSLTSTDDRQVVLGWRGRLPAPRLSGNRAVYPGALPETDLVVDTTRTGFEQFLRLNSRAAISSAGTVRMTLTAEGMTAKAADGGVAFTDNRTGKLVGTLPAPVMWDARVDVRSGEHPHRAPVSLQLAQNGDDIDLTLTPDADFLKDPKTEFPVTVDPSVNLLSTFTTFVQEGYGTDQSTSQELKLGNNGSGQIARSFLRFDNRPVKNKDIKSATLKLWNHHSWSCQARPWEVWDTSTPSTATRWDAQPSWNRKWATSTETKGFGAGCADGWVTADVKTLMQAWAANPHAENSLGIRASDEKDAYTWKRFNSRNAPTNVPVLSVTYNNQPTVPTGLTLSPSTLNAQEKRTYVTSATPVLAAKVSDPDGSAVTAQFEVTADPATKDAGTYAHTMTSASVASGGIAKVTVPANKALPEGGLRLRVRAGDGSADGPWSAYLPFRGDFTKPAAPQVACPDFPKDKWRDRPAGDTTCTLVTTSADGRGFQWGLDDPSTPKAVIAPANTGGKPQTVTFKADKGWHVLHVRTLDAGGLLSATTSYAFGVGAEPAVVRTPDMPHSLQEGATRTPSPLLSGVVTADNQERLRGEFALFGADGTTMSGVALESTGTDAGNRVATAVPAGALETGKQYRWSMRACGEAACSPWTPQRTFTVLAPEPDPVPTTRTLEISGNALVDATSAVGDKDCAGAPCAPLQDGLLRVGTPDGVAWRTWFKPDLAGLPAGARIVGAHLKLRRADCATGADDCAEPAATLGDLTVPWSPAESGQALAAATSEDVYEDQDGLPHALTDLDLGPLVAGWGPENPNHGFSLRHGDESTPAPGVVYHSSRAADPADRPSLVVEYVPPTAPGAAEQVKAVAADGGLLAVWNQPADPGAAVDTLSYTVVVTKDGAEVARTTTEDTRAVFPALANGADHQVTVTTRSAHGAGATARSATVRPTGLPGGGGRYTEAVREYAEARAALLKGTYTSADAAAAAGKHGPVYRDLLRGQEQELTRRREAFKRHNRSYTEITPEFTDVLVGTGPDQSVLVRARYRETSVLTHTDGTTEREESDLVRRFTFTGTPTTPVLSQESADADVEMTLPTGAEAQSVVTVAPPAPDHVDEGGSDPEDKPLITLDDDGMLPEEPLPPARPALLRAAPSGSGTATWAKRNVTIRWEYGQDCTNFVSKALYYGGKMKQRSGGQKDGSKWWQRRVYPRGVAQVTSSWSWAAANNLRNHLKAHRVGREISRYDARPGDILFVYYKSDRTWNHAAVIVSAGGGNAEVRQHGGSNINTLANILKKKDVGSVSIIRPGKTT